MSLSVVSFASLFLASRGANHAVTWAPGLTPNCMEIATGDTVTLTWTGTHNVHTVADHATWTACTLTGSTEVASSAVTTFAWTAGAENAHVVCTIGTHCATGGQKLMLMVGGNLCPADGSVTGSAVCDTAAGGSEECIVSGSAAISPVPTCALFSDCTTADCCTTPVANTGSTCATGTGGADACTAPATAIATPGTCVAACTAAECCETAIDSGAVRDRLGSTMALAGLVCAASTLV